MTPPGDPNPVRLPRIIPRPLAALWRAKWNLGRLAVAATLLALLLLDSAPRLARLQLAALPAVDYAAEAASLRSVGRYAEAISVAEAGLQDPDADRAAVERERALAAEEQSSVLRRVKEVGKGAITGQGESLESLVGAVAADFFVVGDVRDLLIQGSHLAVDGEADPLILGLSAVGVATTLAPEIDWAPALLKVARKSNALTERLGRTLTELARARRTEALVPIVSDVGAIARRTSPAGALRLLRHADTPEDVATLARFLERDADAAKRAMALRAAPGEALDVLKRVGPDADRALIAAGRKGSAGAAWLRTSGRVLLRPHPIIGLAKGVTKGTLPKLVVRALERVDPWATHVIAGVAAWTALELGLLVRRFAATRPAVSAPAASPSPA